MPQIKEAELEVMMWGYMEDVKSYFGNNIYEKYGRILADVYLGDLHINQWMLDNKHAIPYDGGTKHRPDEWDS